MTGRRAALRLRWVSEAVLLALGRCQRHDSSGQHDFTVRTLPRPAAWGCEMLRLELKYEFELTFYSQVRQVRAPKIWAAFPKQPHPFCPELLLESLEVADAHCPDAVFPWCVWNIAENWRHCGALYAQLLAENRTDVIYNLRPSTWKKSGWDKYDVAWEACPVRCTGVLAHLTLPGFWRSARRWPVVAALARLEVWWHNNVLGEPVLGAWYAGRLFGGPTRAAVAKLGAEVPMGLMLLMLRSRKAGTAVREDLLLSSRSMEEILDAALIRVLAPWPSALHGHGAVCSPIVAARRLAREDTARLRLAAGARSAAAAQAELASVVARAMDLAAKCLVGAPKRVLEWFMDGLPLFTMLERVTLPMFAVTRTNASTTVRGDVVIREMVESAGRPYASELVFALKPGRDVVSDKLHHDRVPGCWQLGIFRGAAKVAALRSITPARPLRLIEVGPATGDCHMQIMANFGPSRMKALVLEPFPPALERLRQNLALNGLEGAVEVRAQGLGSRSERKPLCGSRLNDLSLFNLKCADEGAVKFADMDVVSGAELLASSGTEVWDVLSILPHILRESPGVLQGVADLPRRVRFISSGECLVRAEDFAEKGAALITEANC